MKRRFWLTSALVALALTAGPTFAAPLADDGWLPFQGCWRAVDAPAGSLLCIVADGEGVRMVELLSGETVRESRLVADNRDRPVSREGCTGTETAGWSADHRRLYMTTELKCGQQIARNSAGIFAFVTPTEWVSIQAVLVDRESAVRTVRYQLVDAPTDVPTAILNSLRANRLARDAARQFASAPLTISDVRDAADHVHGRAVEAMILERKQKFDFDGKQLVALSKSGMESYLIDALIAVSNPQRFAVRDAKPTELDEVEVRDRRSRSDYCEEFWYSRHCSAMHYGDMNWYYNYSPFNYYSNYGYGSGYYNRPPVIIVVGDDDDREEPRHGRVTRRGYSNGSPASDHSGSERVGSDRSSSERAGSTNSSSGASQSTTTSGSSDSGSDRGKAKPRGGTDDSSSSSAARSSSSSSSSSGSTSSSAQPRASSTSTSSTSSSGSTTSGSSSSADDRGKAKPKTGGN